MIKAVFFDVGGVLIEDNSIGILRRQARIFGIPFQMLKTAMRADRILLMKGLISRREYLRRMSRNFKLSELTVRDIRPSLRPQRYFRENWRVAARLRKNGYVVGIISNAMRPLPFQKKSRLTRYFRPVVLSWRVKSVKPERRIFEIARRRAGVKFSEMAFVDDKTRNVRAANALGIKAFVCKNPVNLKRKLQTLGVSI